MDLQQQLLRQVDSHAALAMCEEAVKRVVGYHDPTLTAGEICVPENSLLPLIPRILRQPGGTLAIRTTDAPYPLPFMTLACKYHAPTVRGTRRAAREARRDARAHFGTMRSMSLFENYEVVEEPSAVPEPVDGAMPAPRRRISVSWPLVGRIVYYPPRIGRGIQGRVDLLLEDGGIKFTPPLIREERLQDDQSGLDSDFAEDEEESSLAAPLQRPASVPVRTMATREDGDGGHFSPTTAAASGVALLSFTGAAEPASNFSFTRGARRPATMDSPFHEPPVDVPPIPDGMSTEQALEWIRDSLDDQNTRRQLERQQQEERREERQRQLEAEWQEQELQRQQQQAEGRLQLHLQLQMQIRLQRERRRAMQLERVQVLMEQGRQAMPVDQIRIMMEIQLQIQLQRRLDEWDQRAREERVPLVELQREPQQRLLAPPLRVLALRHRQFVLDKCDQFARGDSYGPRMVAAYARDLLLPEEEMREFEAMTAHERVKYCNLHSEIEAAMSPMRAQEAQEAAAAAPPPPPPPAPATPVQAPATARATAPPAVSSVRVPGTSFVSNIEVSDQFPATFTSRARMKRQQETRDRRAAAMRAAAAAAGAAAAATSAATNAAASDQQQVAGTSALFDHERRKARRVLDELPGSVLQPAAAAAAAAAAPTAQQRVLGTVVQPSASSSAVHSATCPCPYCPRQQQQPQADPAELQRNALFAHMQQQIQQQQQLQRREEEPQLTLSMEQFIQLQRQQDAASRRTEVPELSESARQVQQQLQQQRQQLQQTLHPSIPRPLPRQPRLERLHQQLQPLTPMPIGLQLAGLPLTYAGPQHPMPRMDMPFYFPFNAAPTTPSAHSPYFYLHQPQPMQALQQPSLASHLQSFVDLPRETTLIGRSNMFATPQQIAAATAAATQEAQAVRAAAQEHAAASAAVAAATGEPPNRVLHENLLAHIMQFTDQRNHVQMLLAAQMSGAVGETAPIGATQRDIEKLTTTSVWTNSGDDDVDPCTVCMSEFEDGESIRSLPCTHAFHASCIDRWLTYNKKCPNCRVDLDNNKPAAAPAALDIAASAADLDAGESDPAIAAAAAAVAADPIVHIEDEVFENAPWNQRARAELEARAALGPTEETTVNTSLALPVVSASVTANIEQ